MLFTSDNHCSNISLKKSKEKKWKKIKKSHSPPFQEAVHLQKNSKEIKNKEKKLTSEMVKKAKKRNVSNISQKKLLTSEMPRLKVGV